MARIAAVIAGRTGAFLALLALLIAAAAHAAPPRVAALDWLAGTWVHESGGARVEEAWLGPANGLMVAANLTARARGSGGYEFLRIAETAQGFSYFASPAGGAPVEFALKELGERRVVFENAAHDFPQRILYWREGEELVARIEGTIGGKARHQEWRFQPSPRPSP